MNAISPIKPLSPDTFVPGEEGVWRDLPNDLYRKAPGISQSELKEFGEYASPLHYSKRERKKANPDMQFGTVCHTAVLEPERLAGSYHVRPAEFKRGTKDAWMEEHRDKPVITAEQEASIPKIVERVKKLPEFGEALKKGHKELSFFKREEFTGALLKCRLDLYAHCVSDNAGWAFDLKKIISGEGVPEAFGKQSDDYGYHIQSASYLWITGAARFVFVPFDGEEPFDACQLEPDAQSLELGLKEYKRLLAEYMDCVNRNEWPGYAEEIQRFKLPTYAINRINNRAHSAWLVRVAEAARI